MPDLNQRSTYEFALPETQIATHPHEPRDECRLLTVRGMHREHHIFKDILDILNPNDCIVVNDVTVRKARFFVQRKTGALIEILMTDDITAPRRKFSCLFRANHLTPGEILTAVQDSTVSVILRRDSDDRASLCEVEFLGSEPVVEILDRIGQLPLPPYIVKQRKKQGDAVYEPSDTELYQTVYANAGNAVAAPTAGLHFTDELIHRIRQKGIAFEKLTLDVGTGTFRPIQTENLNDHVMHTEHYCVSKHLAETLEKTRQNGGRIVAVGTTVVRSLEDQFDRFGKVVPGAYDTNIFIKPGRKFGLIDAMITNFHLPGSTLMVLVSAFAGYENIMEAYRDAIDKGYLFYSYGDAMFLEPAQLL
ncbi:MAG: tRNA preQ1(34) S-adenosylmethionine ribosyltransferase-isomerase QueA [Proteobacteria bacterium]|nr:tRNA preQ1(34) S-adenosylmethionine ribosyltransferase-isomerase QueA [Pseudomonadota bacterium]